MNEIAEDISIDGVKDVAIDVYVLIDKELFKKKLRLHTVYYGKNLLLFPRYTHLFLNILFVNET